jgi:hypothetical protein
MNPRGHTGPRTRRTESPFIDWYGSPPEVPDFRARKNEWRVGNSQDESQRRDEKRNGMKGFEYISNLFVMITDF